MDINLLLLIGYTAVIVGVLLRRVRQARLAMFALGFDNIVLRETLDYARELLVAESGDLTGENLEKYYTIATVRHTEELVREERNN